MNSSKIFISNEEDENTLSLPFVKVDLQNVKQRQVPTTGEEFLMHVISERRNIEEITKCDIDYAQYNKNQSLFFDEVPLAPAPDNLKPTKEWQKIQVADFSEVRCYISRMLSQKPAETKRIKKVHIKKDDLKWWKEFFEEHEPTLSCMLGFNAAQVDRGLVMLISLMKRIKPGNSVDQKTGRWIYAFLTSLKHPLLSDTISIIRDLARQGATIRSLIDPDGENAIELAAPLNLIICIVGHYYRQLDLADSLQ